MPDPVLEDRVSDLCGPLESPPTDTVAFSDTLVIANPLPDIVPRYPADARRAFGHTRRFGTDELHAETKNS